MVTKVVMPKLSLTMKEGTVGKWYKNEGDHVEKNEPIVEVVSEKATYDLEASASGILRKILVKAGADVPVNETLALITDSDEPISEAELSTETSQATFETDTRILASPAAKRLAKERGIDLSLVKGSGLQGRIDEEDVERFVKESSRILPRIKETILLSGLSKVSAERVTTSFRTAPHSTIVMEADYSKTVTLMKQTGTSFTTVIVKIVAEALTEHSRMNSTLDGNEIRIFEEINIGIATATKNGLVVPVLHCANSKSIQEIGLEIEDLTGRAKLGKLTADDVSGGTFTITNLGMYDVDFFMPIINPPEAAILGVGSVKEKPVVANGRIETRPIGKLCLSYDHRIVDGAPAAEFLRRIRSRIEEPEV